MFLEIGLFNLTTSTYNLFSEDNYRITYNTVFKKPLDILYISK